MLISVLFAISGLICWCGISQVISNSVSSSFENAFQIPPLYTTIVLVAITLFLFSFSTFLGILFYARSNVAYLFGDKWIWQTLYKVLALVMLFVGGIATYTFVWDLGDVGIGLMTIFNIGMLYLLGGQALGALREYEHKTKKKL